ISGWKFDNLAITIRHELCEALHGAGHTKEAGEAVLEIVHAFGDEVYRSECLTKWVSAFRERCREKLEHLGDVAADTRRFDDAIIPYSAALSLHPPVPHVVVKRSKVYLAKRLWEDARRDARLAIAFDVMAPWGYGVKQAALHGAGRYDDAIQTFETMLSKMSESPDPQIRELCGQYVDPSNTRATIHRIVQRAIRHSPRILIDTTTGRLQSKAEQEAAFMSLPIVNELVSSMITRVDRRRIKREVRQFFRYVMLSHTWEENEPLFQLVVQMAVYDLDDTPTHDKLKTFCKIVREAGFKWAWSDTCCIEKQDHFVLQEALVAMFKWYRGAEIVFVFLRGVRSPGKLGDLMRSIWNTRAWTLQEYVAAKVIRFYTEEWTPYLNLDIFNHKESPIIIKEMEEATEVSAQQLATLRPGLSSIRGKLRLASTRQTTLVEDAAYSLLAIFSVSGLSAIYGEGENALGRLLAHILAVSGDTRILAWTGQSGGHNSCLPAHIIVFKQSSMSHLPRAIENDEMTTNITQLRSARLDLDLAMKLYDQLNNLPAPWFAASRMKLPCIAFKLPSLLPSRASSNRVYHVDTPFFGTVEIKTRQDLSWSNSLYLVHPWLDVLLDREETQTDTMEDESAEDLEASLRDTDDEEDVDEVGEDDAALLRDRKSTSSPAGVDAVRLDKETRALRLVAHLRQPFGALLLSLSSTRPRSVVYKRVAADSEITVQLREDVPLRNILDNVGILDVL
ncbi:hypothetical protein V8E55_001177, partial [Tylopilus felleus]